MQQQHAVPADLLHATRDWQDDGELCMAPRVTATNAVASFRYSDTPVNSEWLANALPGVCYCSASFPAPNAHMQRACVLLFGSGLGVCPGSLEDLRARLAAHNCVRELRRLGVPAAMRHFAVSNRVFHSACGFEVDLQSLHDAYPAEATFKTRGFPGLFFVLRAPPITFTLYLSGRCNMANARSEREAQRCWTWFYLNVLARFRRSTLTHGSTSSASYRAFLARRTRARLAASLASLQRASTASAAAAAESAAAAAEVLVVVVVGSGAVQHAEQVAMMGPRWRRQQAALLCDAAAESLARDRMAGAWHGHTRECECVGARANDWAYFTRTRADALAALAGDAAARARVLEPHVRARCAPAALYAHDGGVHAVLRACERQSLIVTECAAAEEEDANNDDKDLTMTTTVPWDAHADAQLAVLRQEDASRPWCAFVI